MIKARIIGKTPHGENDDNLRHWLTGGPEHTEPERTSMQGERRNISRQSQVPTGAEWEHVGAALDLKNEQVSLSFDTAWQFASTVAAWIWRNLFSRPDSADWPHPVTGDVVMRHVDDATGYGAWVEEVVRGCLIPKPVLSASGRTVNMSYSITGRYIEPYASGVTGTIEATIGEPARVELAGGDASSWVSGNADGDTIQVSFQNLLLDPSPVEDYIFEVDTDASVEAGHIAISDGDNLAEIAAWLNANTSLRATAAGGTLEVLSPGTDDGEELFLYVDENPIDSDGPATVDYGPITVSGEAVTADLTD